MYVAQIISRSYVHVGGSLQNIRHTCMIVSLDSIGCVESSVIVGWSVGIQLIGWTIHQVWRLAYIGITKEPTTSGHRL